ncbi:MAG TPA: helix-turn-helix transcriptional regulator [Baekduia sp.]
MPDDVVQAFARNLRAARIAAGMTQEDLALATGLDMSNISRYEAGDREPRITMVAKLAAHLDVSPGELLDGLRT